MNVSLINAPTYFIPILTGELIDYTTILTEAGEILVRGRFNYV